MHCGLAVGQIDLLSGRHAAGDSTSLLATLLFDVLQRVTESLFQRSGHLSLLLGQFLRPAGHVGNAAVGPLPPLLLHGAESLLQPLLGALRASLRLALIQGAALLPATGLAGALHVARGLFEPADRLLQPRAAAAAALPGLVRLLLAALPASLLSALTALLAGLLLAALLLALLLGLLLAALLAVLLLHGLLAALQLFELSLQLFGFAAQDLLLPPLRERLGLLPPGLFHQLLLTPRQFAELFERLVDFAVELLG